jgi:hypothetical protein
MNEKCLMIKTKDNRKFFTHEECLNDLVEFSKTFGAEISIVKIKDNIDILGLKDLVPAICNAAYKSKADYELVEIKLARFKNLSPSSKRTQILNTASNIRKAIKEILISGNILEIKELQKQFPNTHLSTLCNHLKFLKKDLNIAKVGKGKYKLS